MAGDQVGPVVCQAKNVVRDSGRGVGELGADEVGTGDTAFFAVHFAAGMFLKVSRLRKEEEFIERSRIKNVEAAHRDAHADW